MSVAEAIFGRLADGELVIIDGGMGSQLQAEGVPMDHVAWSARANLEQPDVVQRVHAEYIRAGAEVLIANSYAASRAALEPAGLGSRVAEGSPAATRLPRDVPVRRPGISGITRWLREFAPDLVHAHLAHATLACRVAAQIGRASCRERV